MNSPVVRIINRPNLLKQRASMLGGKSFDDLVERGTAIVTEHHSDYRAVAQSDLHELRSLLERIKVAPEEAGAQVKGAFRIAHDMKGQATTFGYPLVTNVAASLCGIIERIIGATGATTSNLPAFAEVMRLHVDALHLILAHDMKGRGGALEASLLQGLHAASEKILAGISA